MLAVDDPIVDPTVLGARDALAPDPVTRSAPHIGSIEMMQGGTVPVPRYEPVRITIQERAYVMEVQGIPGDSPILVGCLPLLALDWMIVPTDSSLLDNLEHGGEWMGDAF